MPGLNLPSLIARVGPRARAGQVDAASTPSPMCTSADLERWQPGDRPRRPPASWYAVGAERVGLRRRLVRVAGPAPGLARDRGVADGHRPRPREPAAAGSLRGGSDRQRSRAARARQCAHPGLSSSLEWRNQTSARWRKLGNMLAPCSHVEIDPAEAGFDPSRLAAHRPPLPPLRRRGQAARLPGRDRPRRPDRARRPGRAGRRRGRPPVRRRHAVAHLLDDQADHLGGGDAAVGGGRVRAQGPGREASSPRSRTRACGPAAARTSPVTRPGDASRCACGTCSRTPRA